jgi:hypothetical protein
MNARVGGLDLYARHGMMLAEVEGGAGEGAGREAAGTAKWGTKWGMIMGISMLDFFYWSSLGNDFRKLIWEEAPWQSQWERRRRILR